MSIKSRLKKLEKEVTRLKGRVDEDASPKAAKGSKRRAQKSAGSGAPAKRTSSRKAGAPKTSRSRRSARNAASKPARGRSTKKATTPK